MEGWVVDGLVGGSLKEAWGELDEDKGQRMKSG